MRRLAAFGSLVTIVVGALLARRRRAAARAPTVPVSPAPAPIALPPAPRFLSVPWTLAVDPDDGRELTVRFALSQHMQLDRVDVQETPTQVFVTVLARWQPPAGGWFAWAVAQETTVALAHPLGDRELVHAPDDLGDVARPDL